MTITFFGHGSMHYNDNVEKALTETIKKNIHQKKPLFYAARIE